MGLSVVGAVGSSGWSGIAGSSVPVGSLVSAVSVDSLVPSMSSGLMGSTALSRSVAVETIVSDESAELSDLFSGSDSSASSRFCRLSPLNSLDEIVSLLVFSTSPLLQPDRSKAQIIAVM